jgi:ATP-dependent RNA helicase RhlE
MIINCTNYQAFELKTYLYIMTFQDLQLIEPILKAIKSEGYTIPTPVQAKAIPLALAKKDIICCAQTGTGKTAAFAIPIIQLMEENKTTVRGKRPIRSLILTPTRELAIQIGESFAAYGKNTPLKYKVIYGGVSQHGQVNSLQSGIDVLIATPGRLLDLINQKFVNLSYVEFFVLDEADRMLDMGFVQDVKKVITRLPYKKQSLFFSATMPGAIVQLADSILVNPARVEITPVSSTVDLIQQVVYFVDKKNKNALLKDVLKGSTIDRALVFTRTKHGADRVARDLTKAGINSQAIHGNKSQNARQTALSNFKSSLTRVLVATDIAARGIDIDDLSHVINFELPNIPESYVHRIGRTGRAGANGMAIAFCDAEEKAYLKDIQKLIGKNVPVVDDHAYPLMDHEVVKAVSGSNRGQRNGSTRNSSSARKNGSSNGGYSGNRSDSGIKKNRSYNKNA